MAWNGSGSLVTLLGLLMVLAALGISGSSTLHQMVALYRAQSALLAVLTVLRSTEPGSRVLSVLALVPVTLAVVAPALLARASVNVPRHEPAASATSTRDLLRTLRAARSRAEHIWLVNGRSVIGGGRAAAIEMSGLVAAVLVAGRLTGEHAAAASYTVTFALCFQGVFTMINKRDIVAQIIGLLVIDQALLLAAILLAPPRAAPMLVLGLLLYVLITLTILLWMLPALHRASGSIEIRRHTRLQG